MTLSSQPFNLFETDRVESVIEKRQDAEITRHADGFRIRELLHARFGRRGSGASGREIIISLLLYSA